MTEQTEKKFTEALIEYAKGFGEWQYAMPCAKEGARLFVDSLWHPANEKPVGVDDADRDILIVTMGPEYYGNKLQTWHIFSYMSWDWVKAHAGEFEKWAYLEDMLPNII